MVYDDDPPEPLGAIDDDRLRLLLPLAYRCRRGVDQGEASFAVLGPP
jgi:hypothetical protein